MRTKVQMTETGKFEVMGIAAWRIPRFYMLPKIETESTGDW